MDVKQALDEAGNDIEKARDVLRKKGAALAAKKGERETGEGAVFSYIHPGARVGVMLKLFCETDFVARTEDFQHLGQDIALHIAAMGPQYIARDEVPADILEREKEVYAAQVAQSGKSEDVVSKIIEGKLEKFYGESVLLDQSFVKSADITVQQRIEETVTKVGENIRVGSFVRFEL